MTRCIVFVALALLVSTTASATTTLATTTAPPALASANLRGGAEGLAAAGLSADDKIGILNCGSRAYNYCCNVGTPCRCGESSKAAGQCGWEAYSYCCNFGTPCSC